MPITLYTEVKDGIMNIIHCHLNDYDEYVTVESIYLKDKEDVKDHYEFGVDSIGMPLNYKILVKDWAVHAILYKSSLDGEVQSLPFKEERIDS